METITNKKNELSNLKYTRNNIINITGLIGVPVITGTHILSRIALVTNSYAGAYTFKTVCAVACVASAISLVNAARNQFKINKLNKELRELGEDTYTKRKIEFHHIVPAISLSAVILLNQLGGVWINNAKENWYEECANDAIKAISHKKVGTISDKPIMSTESNEDEFLMPGSYLVNELIENNTKYCKIYDEYYTLEGNNLKKFTVAEICEPQTVVTEAGEIIYKPKNGGIIEDNKEIVYTTIVLAPEDGEYVIPNGYILISIDEDIPTKKYEELNNTDIYTHVPDPNTKNKYGNYEGTLLIKKR